LVFEPFRKIEVGTEKKYGGNGIGLAIVKAYVEQLNGLIALESDLGVGTKVMVSIPLNGAKSSDNSK
jgi:signal transduction histidine kinase